MQKAMAGEAGGPISAPIAKEALKPQFDEWQGLGFRLDGEGQARGFYHYGENIGYFAGFGAGVSNGRGWIIMSNAQKERLDPIVKAIGAEFGWTTRPDKALHAMRPSTISGCPGVLVASWLNLRR
jgi:hypothetical protein